MSGNSYREKAKSERVLGEATKLPNVRERHLRSADAYDAIAAREEHTSAFRRGRDDEAAARIRERKGAE